MADMILTIDTPDVGTTDITDLIMDVRFLLFPEQAADNAGFYMPSLFFHPQ